MKKSIKIEIEQIDIDMAIKGKQGCTQTPLEVACMRHDYWPVTLNAWYLTLVRGDCLSIIVVPPDVLEWQNVSARGRLPQPRDVYLEVESSFAEPRPQEPSSWPVLWRDKRRQKFLEVANPHEDLPEDWRKGHIKAFKCVYCTLVLPTNAMRSRHEADCRPVRATAPVLETADLTPPRTEARMGKSDTKCEKCGKEFETARHRGQHQRFCKMQRAAPEELGQSDRTAPVLKPSDTMVAAVEELDTLAEAYNQKAVETREAADRLRELLGI